MSKWNERIELREQMLELTGKNPELHPLLCELLDLLEHVTPAQEDVEVVLRVARQSPVLVHLLADLIEASCARGGRYH